VRKIKESARAFISYKFDDSCQHFRKEIKNYGKPEEILVFAKTVQLSNLAND